MKDNGKIAVMQAFSSGKKVEQKSKKSPTSKWRAVEQPSWNWDKNEYRLYQEPVPVVTDEQIIRDNHTIVSSLQKKESKYGSEVISIHPSLFGVLMEKLNSGEMIVVAMTAVNQRAKDIFSELNEKKARIMQ